MSDTENDTNQCNTMYMYEELRNQAKILSVRGKNSDEIYQTLIDLLTCSSRTAVQHTKLK